MRRLLTAEQLNDAIGYASARTLAPAETIATDLAKSKADLAARLAALPAELPAWEAAAAKRVAASPCWAGQWNMVGLFEAKSNAGDAHKTAFPPEQDADLKRTYADGKLAWKAQPDWQDGKTFQLPAGTGSYYLFRIIRSERAEAAKLSFNQSGAYKVWVNGQPVHKPQSKTPQRRTCRGCLVRRRKPTARQSQPVTGRTDSAQIDFRIESWGGKRLEKPALPPFVMETLIQPAASADRTTRAASTEAQYQQDSDGRARGLRNSIERLIWRMDYATQRPFLNRPSSSTPSVSRSP